MMNNLLGLLFTMNLQASLLALVILLFRRVFKKTPRRYICLLWVLFVLRLLCPLSIESDASPVPAISGDFFTDGVQAVQTGQTAQAAMDAPSAGSPENPVEPGEEEGAEALPPIIVRQLPQILIWAWAGGGVFFSLRCLYQYLRLRRAVRTAVRLEEGVYQCEGFRSPFVAGVFRPRIYIPFYIPADEREPILRHEKMHIQNHDPLLYFLAMAVTCIHW